MYNKTNTLEKHSSSTSEVISVLESDKNKEISKNLLLAEVKQKLNSKKPKIFLKKLNNNVSSIPLKKISNSSGIIKYSPPLSLEWVNSVYSYNKNYNKSLTVADKIFMGLAKSYLNLKYRRTQKENKIRRAKAEGFYLPLYRTHRRRVIFKKRVSFNKVIIAKGGVKHTSTKAIVTLFFYNKLNTTIAYKSAKNLFLLFYKKNKKYINPIFKVLRSKETDSLKKLNSKLSRAGEILRKNVLKITKKNLLKEKLFQYKPVFTKLYEKKLKYSERQRQRKLYFLRRDYNNIFHALLVSQVLTEKERSIIYLRFLNYKLNLSSSAKKYINQDNNPLLKDIQAKLKFYKSKGSVLANARLYFFKLRLGILRYNNHIKYMYLNQLKFKKKFIENFRKISSKIYNKKVLFNFVRINKYYYNSNILSQMIAMKLRKRENSLIRVVRRAMVNIELPERPLKKKDSDIIKNLESMRYKIRVNNFYHKNIWKLLRLKNIEKTNVFWFNSILFKYNKFINPFSIFGRILLNHRLNQQNSALFSLEKRAKRIIRKQLKKIVNRFNLKIKFIKNSILAGIRLEIKGRLTKRFKAARPLYKLKWIGGSRNVDASFFKLPVALTRGHVLSNIESTKFSSYRRIGAYGVSTIVSGRDKPK